MFPLYGLSGVFRVAVPEVPYAIVSAISGSPPNGAEYFAGQVVTATVTFSEEVAVSGMPQLPLRIGDTLRDADFADGNGTDTLSFSYTVQSDDADDDGISIDGFALKLNGGAITRQGDPGVNAVLTHAGLTDDEGQKVAGTPVTVSFGKATYTVAEGSSVTVTVSLSADPKRSVTIPISKTNQGGATAADYSGVPASVVFASGETEQSFSFSATDDDRGRRRGERGPGLRDPARQGVSAGHDQQHFHREHHRQRRASDDCHAQIDNRRRRRRAPALTFRPHILRVTASTAAVTPGHRRRRRRPTTSCRTPRNVSSPADIRRLAPQASSRSTSGQHGASERPSPSP